jgi:hypothetical protein
MNRRSLNSLTVLSDNSILYINCRPVLELFQIHPILNFAPKLIRKHLTINHGLFFFIAAPSSAGLSHRKPASAGTYCWQLRCTAQWWYNRRYVLCVVADCVKEMDWHVVCVHVIVCCRFPWINPRIIHFDGMYLSFPVYTVELGYNVMKGTEYFVSL